MNKLFFKVKVSYKKSQLGLFFSFFFPVLFLCSITIPPFLYPTAYVEKINFPRTISFIVIMIALLKLYFTVNRNMNHKNKLPLRCAQQIIDSELFIDIYIILTGFVLYSGLLSLGIEVNIIPILVLVIIYFLVKLVVKASDKLSDIHFLRKFIHTFYCLLCQRIKNKDKQYIMKYYYDGKKQLQSIITICIKNSSHIIDFQHLISEYYKLADDIIEILIVDNHPIIYDLARDKHSMKKIITKCLKSIDLQDYLKEFLGAFYVHLTNLNIHIEHNPYYTNYTKHNRKLFKKYYRNQIRIFENLISRSFREKAYFTRKEIKDFNDKVINLKNNFKEFKLCERS